MMHMQSLSGLIHVKSRSRAATDSHTYFYVPDMINPPPRGRVVGR